MASNKAEFVVPSEWNDDELKVALSAALRANNASKKADVTALARTSIAYAGAYSLGWFTKVDGKVPEDKTYSAFAGKVGLSSVTSEMGTRYLAHAHAYSLGITPDSEEDQLLRKSGVMSALKGRIAEAPALDKEIITEMIADAAPTNKAMRSLAEKLGRTVPADKSDTSESKPPVADRGAALARIVTDGKIIAEHMDVMTEAELGKLDKIMSSIAKARAARREADAKLADAS